MKKRLKVRDIKKGRGYDNKEKVYKDPFAARKAADE